MQWLGAAGHIICLEQRGTPPKSMRDLQPASYHPSMTQKVPAVIVSPFEPPGVTTVFHMLHYLLGGDLRPSEFYEAHDRHLLECGIALNQAEANSGICLVNGVHFFNSDSFAKVHYMTEPGPLASGELPRSDNETQIFQPAYHGTAFDSLVKIL